MLARQLLAVVEKDILKLPGADPHLADGVQHLVGRQGYSESGVHLERLTLPAIHLVDGMSRPLCDPRLDRRRVAAL
jgi:hypothetical protein